jgi:ankyrin repeat protein
MLLNIVPKIIRLLKYLHDEITKGNLYAVKFLHKEGIDIHKKNTEGEEAIIIAAKHHHLSMQQIIKA